MQIKQKISYSTLVTIALIAGIFAYCNFENLYFGFSFYLGLLFAPYVFRKISPATSHRYLWLVLLIAGLLLFRRSGSLYYALAGFSILYILESQWGKLNQLPIFLLGAVSAFVGHIAYIWSFPIRLKLSDLAARALSAIGYPVQADGNLIVLNGNTFSVDPACMGLHTLVTSLVLGLLILAHFERKHTRTFNFWQVGLAMFGVLCLSVFANFNRLLTLIIFHVLPDNPMHDVIGLLSLVVYVLVPFYWLVKWINCAYFARAVTEHVGLKPYAFANKTFFSQKRWVSTHRIMAKFSQNRRRIFSSLIPLVLLLLSGLQFKHIVSPQDNALQDIRLDGFEQSMIDHGVLKLENEAALIYIKPPAKAFQGSHDPRICWRGSGYEFTQIKRTIISGQAVYTAVLKKEDTQLYTAWWFDNGQEKTIDEWDWRWSTLSGKGGFRLVNVATAEAWELELVVGRVLEVVLPINK